MLHKILLGLVAIQAVDPAATSEPISSTVETPAPAPAVIAALTPIVVSIGQTISAKTAIIGQRFPISLAEPLTIGTVMIPAGITGEGEVIHAAKPGAAGRAGELILAARWLQWGNIRIPIRRLRFGRHGANNEGTAMIVGATIGVIGFAISGGDVAVPAGTVADAIVAAEVPLPSLKTPGGTP